MFDNIVYRDYYGDSRCIVDYGDSRIIYNLDWYSGIQWHTVYRYNDNRDSFTILMSIDHVSYGAAYLPAN